MAVYRVTKKGFEPLAETSFETEKLYERYDLQRMLRDRPDLLEEGLFIVGEEYGDWEESNRRIDLLGLDGEGRLVVIELKRSDQDSLMDLQAIRYAAMGRQHDTGSGNGSSPRVPQAARNGRRCRRPHPETSGHGRRGDSHKHSQPADHPGLRQLFQGAHYECPVAQPEGH